MAAATGHIPTQVIGEYTVYLMQRLGRGTFGIVYKATDRYGNPVAVKCIDEYPHPSMALDEYANLSRVHTINHQNVIRILDIHRELDCIWAFMEFCQHGDLHKFFGNNYNLVATTEDRIRLMIQISSGLAFLHDERIIHRDIKPANILVTRVNGETVAKLTDFGLARILEENEITSRMSTDVGTYCYKAPELLCEGPKTYYKEVDIFALGITFLSMLQAEQDQPLRPVIENDRDREEAGALSIGMLMFIRKRRNLDDVQVVVEGAEDSERVKQLKRLIVQMICYDGDGRPIADTIVMSLQAILMQDQVPQVWFHYHTKTYLHYVFPLTFQEQGVKNKEKGKILSLLRCK